MDAHGLLGCTRVEENFVMDSHSFLVSCFFAASNCFINLNHSCSISSKAEQGKKGRAFSCFRVGKNGVLQSLLLGQGGDKSNRITHQTKTNVVRHHAKDCSLLNRGSCRCVCKKNWQTCAVKGRKYRGHFYSDQAFPN